MAVELGSEEELKAVLSGIEGSLLGRLADWTSGSHEMMAGEGKALAKAEET